MSTFDADIAAAELAEKTEKEMAQKKKKEVEVLESIEITDTDDQSK